MSRIFNSYQIHIMEPCEDHASIGEGQEAAKDAVRGEPAGALIYHLLRFGLTEPVLLGDGEKVWNEEETADGLVEEDGDEADVQKV